MPLMKVENDVAVSQEEVNQWVDQLDNINQNDIDALAGHMDAAPAAALSSDEYALLKDVVEAGSVDTYINRSLMQAV